MPSGRVTTLAKHGPATVIVLTLGLGLVYVGVDAVTSGPPLSETDYWTVALGLLSLVSAASVAQGLFMILRPATTVEAGISPVQAWSELWIDLTPESRTAARLVGALEVASGLFGVVMVVVLSESLG